MMLPCGLPETTPKVTWTGAGDNPCDISSWESSPIYVTIHECNWVSDIVKIKACRADGRCYDFSVSQDEMKKLGIYPGDQLIVTLRTTKVHECNGTFYDTKAINIEKF